MQLASSFRYGSPMLRSDALLSDDQIRCVAPSIFSDSKHQSRSERYTYIPTVDVLRGLRNEGFQPFMVCQTRVRDQDKRDFTKHLIRMRPASDLFESSHDGIPQQSSHSNAAATFGAPSLAINQYFPFELTLV